MVTGPSTYTDIHVSLQHYSDDSMFFLHEKGFLFAQTLMVIPLVKSKNFGQISPWFAKHCKQLYAYRSAQTVV